MEQRLAKVREYKRKRKIQRQNESPEKNKCQLKKEQEYINKKRRMKSQNDSPANRGQKLLKQKDNMGKCEPSDRQTLTVIRNCHKSVSTGPLYICTCCARLWYRHSVSPANQLTLKNPDLVKYLQEIISVDNIKWVCQTCSKLLKNNRAPPCAIVNGMEFPTERFFT